MKIALQYDGSAFCGFQRQRGLRTVQQVLEEGLGKVFGHDVRVTGAGRTDAGVHALGQVVSTTCTGSIPTVRIVQAANSVLPEDLALVSAEEVAQGFHARRDAVGKTYRYVFDTSPARSPFRRRYSLYVGRGLDAGVMDEASKRFVGRHDFSAFRASGSSVKTSVRTVAGASVHELPHLRGCIAFEITADGFLYNMVRIMAGLLLDVGTGKVDVEKVRAIIESRDRSRVGATLPASGLWLVSVQY
ncbi:MAG: tRNA pseudouridine(38-40) synthase TruA [Bacillota bacterium]|nr:tRNA pseudouridine(38-40) synthase TruA [Bacillota bacterium]